MTLDEAITHAEEKARACGPCAQEHAQLAEWLRELKAWRESEGGSLNFDPDLTRELLAVIHDGRY